VNVESEATYENGILKLDHPLPLGEQQRVRITVHAAEGNGEAVHVRRELARDLIHRVDQLPPLVGELTLAANLQLLKRDLSRCHDALKDYPAEGDFLSLVTLVESALVPLTWKQFTRQQLETVRQVFDLGSRPAPVCFADHEKARQLFASNHVEVTPQINLGAIQGEDLTDGDEA
jgi:predicted DNA-binding antitoxin AbrB/MazE fold protein